MKIYQKYHLAVKYYYMYLLQWMTVRTGLLLAKPSHIFISNSLRCNLRCKMCHSWDTLRNENNQVPKEKILTTLKEIRVWLGKVKVTFCGPGETFSNPDIIEYIEYATSIGLIVVFTSNGTLINKELARKLVNAKVLQANISIDGIATHDVIRGVKGTYQKAITGIKNLCEIREEVGASTRIMINCTVMGLNLDELIELGDWALANEVNIRYNPIELSKEERISSNLWIEDYSKLDYVLDQLIVRRNKSTHILNSLVDFETMRLYYRNPDDVLNRKRKGLCLGCVESLYIGHDGNVLTCTKPIGSIYDNGLRKIWNSKEAKDLLAQLRKCDVRCLGKNKDRGTLIDRIEVFLRSV